VSALPDPAVKRAFVERMFDEIAPRYDLMNRLMTLGIDRSWRRLAIEALGLGPGDRVVDLGCGTGDLTAAAAAAGARAIGIDLSRRMLVLAARRNRHCWFVQTDAASLPLPDRSCRAVVSGFALRNFVSIPAVLRESARVLRKGGRIALLEIDHPQSAAGRAALDLYFGRVVPLLGRIVSRGYAYAYLADSRSYLPNATTLTNELRSAGFERVEKRRLTMGAAQLVTAVRS
jgi:demethylmenaquinone methyltransferase/2-methoxy-6-polyprenyl-1,4-benzoquinol methylase